MVVFQHVRDRVGLHSRDIAGDRRADEKKGNTRI